MVVDTSNKRIAKNTVLLYIRQLLTLGLSLYISRLTLKVLGETDLGIYATVAGFTALLSTVTSSLAAGTQRFITFELGRGDLEKINRVYCTSINIHTILSGFLVISGEIIGVWFIFYKMNVPPDRIMTAFWVFQLTLLSTATALINAPNNAEIIAHEDMGTFAFVSIIEVTLRCILVFTLFYITWDKLLMYSLYLFAIQLFIICLCVSWCHKKYKEVKFHRVWDKDLLKSMISVTGWMSLNQLSVTGFIQGVNILLNLFFGPALNAAYTIAMQAYSGIRQFCSSFQLASNPQIVKLYSVGEKEKMNQLLISVCKLSFFLIFILALPFIINARFVMELWLDIVPKHTESFFILLLVYAFVDVFAYPLDIAAQATGHLKKYSISLSLIILSILIFSYIAFSIGAIPESIYIIAIVISWISLGIRLYFLKNMINLSVAKFVKEVVAKLVMVCTFSLIIPLLLLRYMPPNLITTVILFVTSFCSAVFFVYVIGLSFSEKSLVKMGVFTIYKRLAG